MSGPSRLTTATAVVTMTTGMIEAVSFVGLGYVFTAMMTGNLLFIGFDLAGVSSAVSQNISLTMSVVALVAFAFGAVTGHRLSGVLSRHTDRWLASVTFILGLLMLLAAVLAIGLRGHADHVTTRHLVGSAVRRRGASARGRDQALTVWSAQARMSQSLANIVGTAEHLPGLRAGTLRART